jgi:hypothetical protein
MEVKPVKTEDHTDLPLRSEDEMQAARHEGGRAAREGASPDRLVRLSVNLGPEVADSLKGYANRKGVSVTEAVRRAIAVLGFIDDAQTRGASLQVEEDGVRKEIVFLA